MYSFGEFLVSIYLLILPFLVVRYYFYLKDKRENKYKDK